MDVSDYGSNVNDMSQKLNISKKGFQEWSYILGQSGTDIGVLQMGMKTLSNAAVDGNKSFKKLGISQKELQTLSTEELFDRTITQLAGMEAGNERTALAADLFGRSATELLPILNSGADGIEAMRKQAEDYGLVMSDEAVQASDDFGDSVSLMQQTLTGMKNRLMGEFLPSLTLVTDGLATLFTGDMSGLDGIDQGIGDFVTKISEAIPQIVEVGGSILQALVTAIVTNLPLLVDSAMQLVNTFSMFILENLPMFVETALTILTTLATGLSEQLPVLIPTIVGVILSIVDILMANVPLLIDAAFQILTGLALGITEQLPTLIPAIIELMMTIVTSLLENLPLLVSAAADLIIGLATGLINAIPTLLTYIPQILDSIVQAITDLVYKLVEAGGNLVKGIWDGISASTQWIYDQISGWVGSVIDWIKGLFGIASPSKEMADGVGKYISEGVGEGITDNVSAVTTAASQLSDAVVAEAATMNQAGVEVVNALGQGMLTRMMGLGQQLIAWFNTAVVTPLRNLNKTFYELGRWMMMGFIIGMLSRKAEIISDAIMLAKAATDAFRDNLRISSPSKVMYEFGEYFVSGFTSAVDAGVNDVRNAVSGLSNAALSFGSDVTQISSVNGTTGGTGVSIGAINFNQPVTSPSQTASRISRELAGVLYA